MDDPKSAAWFEPLRARELEILKMISAGLSNREIAHQLLLSLETVKWYNKQIFGKLEVSSRTQAVARAKERGLLDIEAASPPGIARLVLNNLPVALNPFVGREREIAEIIALLQSNRLVVLTGPGGSGKTRLALQVSGRITGAFPDGVWLVELADLRDPSLVPLAVAQVLNLAAGGDAPKIELLKRFLERKRLLLLLDNFEHLPAAAPWVGEILAAAPQVSVLATSREHLNVYGEQEYPVHPLALPDLSQKEPVEQLLSYEAVQLFMLRARAVLPGFTATGEQARAIAQISARLDGLPLALELAASQVKVFPPQVLAQHLQESLVGLLTGPRDLPARQRTLHATIEWSHALLLEDEKILFARLAVFSGATIPAVQQVCGQGLPSAGLEALAALVNKNLLYTRQDPSGELRFLMLETIREFARECLLASGEAELLNERHAAYYTRLAEECEPELRRDKPGYWFARLRVEQNNIRSVLTWSFGGGQVAYGLRLVAALRDYCYYTGISAEGQSWTEMALNHAEQAPPDLLAGVLRTAGMLAYGMGQLQKGRSYQRQALEIYQQLGDERNAAWTMVLLSIQYLGFPAELDQGIRMCQEGLDRLRLLKDKPGMAQALNILGEFARITGDDRRAQDYYQECLAIVQETGERTRQAMLYVNLSFLAFHEQEPRLALDLIRQALTIMQELQMDYSVVTFIEALTGPAAALGAPQPAAQLLGACAALLEAMGATHQPGDQPEIEHYQRAVRQQLDEKTFQEAWQAGRSLTYQEAVASAFNLIELLGR